MDAPRILVDATAVPQDRGGVGRYLDNVVRGLDQLGAPLLVAAQGRDREVWARLAPGAALHLVPRALERRPVRMVWEQTGLATLAARTRAEVLLSPHYTTSLGAPLPKVVTLHDATFFSDPQVHLQVKARFFRAATRTALRVGAACVVPSSATRDELVRWAGADATRIDVVPHGVDLEVFRPADAAHVEGFTARHDLVPGTYVAFLGTLEPRKNLAGLVRGWARAFGDATDPPALVLAGGAGWDDALDDELVGVPARLRVVRTGYLPLEDLRALFAGAAVVAYPSLGEGFGLPVLEAMACGAAVLTTPRLSLPEVGGDAVAYCEPDAASIAAALSGLVADRGLRERLGAAAVERARTFTWERCARSHLDVLARVAR